MRTKLLALAAIAAAFTILSAPGAEARWHHYYRHYYHHYYYHPYYYYHPHYYYRRHYYYRPYFNPFWW